MTKAKSRAEFVEKVLREFSPESIEITMLDEEPLPLVPTFEFRFTNSDTKRRDFVELCNVLWWLGADIKHKTSDGVVVAEV